MPDWPALAWLLGNQFDDGEFLSAGRLVRFRGRFRDEPIAYAKSRTWLLPGGSRPLRLPETQRRDAGCARLSSAVVHVDNGIQVRIIGGYDCVPGWNLAGRRPIDRERLLLRSAFADAYRGVRRAGKHLPARGRTHVMRDLLRHAGSALSYRYRAALHRFVRCVVDDDSTRVLCSVFRAGNSRGDCGTPNHSRATRMATGG